MQLTTIFLKRSQSVQFYRVFVFCCLWSMLLLVSLTLNINLRKHSTEPRMRSHSKYLRGLSSSSSSGPLSFLILGDWGKGGANGATWSSFHGNSLQRQYHSNNDDDDDDDYNTEQTFEKSDNDIVDEDFVFSTFAQNNNNNNNKQTYQVAIATAMGEYARSTQYPPQFVIAVGDNFYTKGVTSTTDSLWTSLWSDIYLIYSGLAVPWYPVLGNHDYGYGSSGAMIQIARTKEFPSGYWQMPSTNYSKTYVIPTGGTVRIVYIDTTTLAPSVNGCCNSKGGISEETQAARIKNQLYHINAMLEEAVQEKHTFLLVVGHYPVHSSGNHGDTVELLSYLLPLLEFHKVDAYICGHDHISEHLQYNGIEYFVVGAGSMTDNLKVDSQASLLWYGVGYSAYASVQVTSSELTITYLDSDNANRYEYVMKSKNPGGGSQTDDGTERKKDEGKSNNRILPFSDSFLKSSLGLLAVSLFLSGMFFVYRGKPSENGKGKKKRRGRDKVVPFISTARRNTKSNKRTQAAMSTEKMIEELFLNDEDITTALPTRSTSPLTARLVELGEIEIIQNKDHSQVQIIGSNAHTSSDGILIELVANPNQDN